MSSDQVNINHLARLSRLKLDADDTARMQTELSDMQHQIDKVQQLDTSSLELKINLDDTTALLRKDDPTQPDSNLSSNAQAHKDGFVVVPKVIG